MPKDLGGDPYWIFGLFVLFVARRAICQKNSFILMIFKFVGKKNCDLNLCENVISGTRPRR